MTRSLSCDTHQVARVALAPLLRSSGGALRCKLIVKRWKTTSFVVC